MKKILTLSLLMLLSITCLGQAKEIFEVRIYNINNVADGEKFDNFVTESLLPAYERMNVKIGAWTEYESQSPVRYMLFIYKDITSFQNSKNDIWKDEKFLKSSKEYFAESAETPVYTRFESYLCEGFDAYPKAVTPDGQKGIYEMRIYDSPNEQALERKMHMFNNGEIDIFKNSGVNCLFFGEVLAGSGMPVLIYMTWYNNIDERNTNWKKFSSSEAWANMKKNSFYDKATTKTRNIFLTPLKYSQF